MSARHLALELFAGALRAVDGRAAVARALRGQRASGPVFAIGKAASAMALGAFDALGDSIEEVLVVTKDGHADPDLARLRQVTVIESAHPVPDERSIAAGAELECRLARLGKASQPIFLISGGSSSLIDSLREGIALSDLRALNEQGLGSGLDISALNAERARVSRLKRGGVARLLGGRPATALFISDVPADDTDVIGSGLLGRDGSNEDHVRRIVVASVDVAVGQVLALAPAHGLELQGRAARFDGDAAEVAGDFVAAMRTTGSDGLVWGGESTVRLPANHGRGGRNTHLALAAARLLRAGDSFTILAAGTDGTDGPTSDAGAVVDAGSVERAELGGCDIERAFREFDSGTALEAAGDLVHTGPTGTNVGDILIGIKHSSTSLRGRRGPPML
jgi:hydroxypyruvate reductase